MQKVQPRLTWTLLFTALLLLVYFGTTYLSSPIETLYRNADGLSSARNVAQIAALLGAAGLFLTAFMIAIPAALQPAPWYRKILYVLPLYLLLLLVASIASTLAGVGVLGNFLNIQGVGTITFAAALPAVGAVLATIAVVIAAAWTTLGEKTLKRAMTIASVSTTLSIIASLAMLVSVVIVSTSQPSGFGFGGRPDGQGGGNRPGNSGAIQPPAGFAPPASATAAPSGQNTQNNAAPQQGGDGRPGGDFGGRPGGEGGPINPATVASHFEIGGVTMAILAAIALVGMVSGGLLVVRQRGGESAGQSEPRLLVSYRREIGLVVVCSAAVTLILVGVTQLVPVAHDNPPVQSTINWDSPETKELAYRACMNCHSNETTWPWYSYVAPASWLTVMHVDAGRQRLNLSELNSIPAFRRADMAGEMAQQIRNGAMPPADYLLLHPEARLTDAEKQQLIQGLQKSLAGS